MKKRVLLSIVALTVAFAAAAQNKAIDKLAAKYADKEGYTVLNMEGDMAKEMGKMVGGKAGKDVDISKLLENIVMVTVIVAEKPDPESAEDIKNAIATTDYTPIVTKVSERESIKILSNDIKRGKYKKKQEIVITVIDADDTIMVRIVGKIDMATLTKMAESMKK